MTKLFEFGKHEYDLGLVLDSGNQEHACTLSLYAFKYFVTIKLPRLIWPAKVRRDYTSIDGKRTTHFDFHNRLFGFFAYEENVHMYYGKRSFDSWLDSKVKLFGIPWRQTRRVRYDFYTPNQEHFCSINSKLKFDDEYSAIKEAEKKVPKLVISFDDFDGEKIIACCYIEEMEWRKGTGLFKWVSYIAKPIIARSLVYVFNKEVGRTKNSWKGGIVSSSIRIKEGDNILEVFENHLKNGKVFKIESPNCKILG